MPTLQIYNRNEDVYAFYHGKTVQDCTSYMLNYARVNGYEADAPCERTEFPDTCVVIVVQDEIEFVLWVKAPSLAGVTHWHTKYYDERKRLTRAQEQNQEAWLALQKLKGVWTRLDIAERLARRYIEDGGVVLQ